MSNSKSIQKELKVRVMTCTSCEIKIENKLKKIAGINSVKASFSKATVTVTYDPSIIDLDRIIAVIEKLDYKVVKSSNVQAIIKQEQTKKNENMPIMQLLGMLVIIIAGYMILSRTGIINSIPLVTQDMGFGILFVVGMLTSIHCVAMCGGINLSQCVSCKVDTGEGSKLAKFKPSMMYNTGRVVSYTILGGIFGTFGSLISVTAMAKGIITVLAGVIMVIMGLNMLNIFPGLRKFNPRMPKIFANKIHNNNGEHRPFYVGLLNGLMPCGPLQAMQIYALGTGSFIAGAGAMFFFSIGTVPLMFGFGAISSLLNRKFTYKMMKVSAILVMVLGVIMLNRGFNISGLNMFKNVAYAQAGSGNIAIIEGNVQSVTTKLESGSYTPFTVQKGIPVRWTITAEASQINGCNGTITIPSYGVSKTLEPGDNIIEFTPTSEGNVLYTCSMGMIKSNITVVSNIAEETSKVTQQADSTNPQNNESTDQQGAVVGSGGCCSTPPAASSGGGGCCG